MFEDLENDDGPFMKAEYQKAKTALQQAAGPDSIPQEVMKNCATDDIMLEICNTALTNNHSPSQWTLPQIITLPKKGDLSMPYNYRGIGLMCFVAKLFSMILLRLRKALEPKLRILFSHLFPIIRARISSPYKKLTIFLLVAHW